MQTIRIKLKFFIIIVIILYIFYRFTYPIYAKVVCDLYAKQFAKIFNSNDIKRYDSFFSNNTKLEWGSYELNYQEARETINQVIIQNKIKSEGSYGNLDEDQEWKILKEYTVSLMLPIIKGINGEKIGVLEGEFILKRKWLLFFEIKSVRFYNDKNDFLEKIFIKGK